MEGFSSEQVTALEAAGWVKSTDAGYRASPDSFVGGTFRRGYKLTHARGGLYRLDSIQDGLGDGSKLVKFEEALRWFGIPKDSA